MQLNLPLTASILASVHKEPPIIDIDSTVFVQFAIFLITALLLNRLLFKPFLATRALREKGIEGARDEAHRMEEEAAAQMADFDKALAAGRGRAEKERQTLRGEAEEYDRKTTEEARRSAHAATEDARKKLLADSAAARTELGPRAEELARAIFRKIIRREVA
ncbi:MAG: ATP synthase F0 subunit B [Pseudomonadota bacterium]